MCVYVQCATYAYIHTHTLIPSALMRRLPFSNKFAYHSLKCFVASYTMCMCVMLCFADVDALTFIVT